VKKYSMELAQGMSKKGVAQEKIEEYRDMLITELKKLGASGSELELVSEEMIINAINNGRKAVDIAWAIFNKWWAKGTSQAERHSLP